MLESFFKVNATLKAWRCQSSCRIVWVHFTRMPSLPLHSHYPAGRCVLQGKQTFQVSDRFDLHLTDRDEWRLELNPCHGGWLTLLFIRPAEIGPIFTSVPYLQPTAVSLWGREDPATLPWATYVNRCPHLDISTDRRLPLGLVASDAKSIVKICLILCSDQVANYFCEQMNTRLRKFSAWTPIRERFTGYFINSGLFSPQPLTSMDNQW